VIEPDTAFWAIVESAYLPEALKSLVESFESKKEEFQKEMHYLRFELKPSAVYFNPTERCNLNCSYCYIPEKIRKDGKDMSKEEIFRSLEILKEFFYEKMAIQIKPQIIFHGSEPTLVKNNIFLL